MSHCVYYVQIVGACCNPYGYDANQQPIVCMDDATIDVCQFSGGLWQGDGTTCPQCACLLFCVECVLIRSVISDQCCMQRFARLRMRRCDHVSTVGLVVIIVTDVIVLACNCCLF